jgi:NitT/TauT family transport system substrate-binding protein
VRRLRILATAFLVIGLIASCSSSKPKSSDAKGKQLDKVTYVTGFGTFGREAYAYYGLDKGYFRDEGIDLTIKPGAGGNQNLKYLDSGQAQFTAIDYSGAIVDYGSNIDAHFKIISAINQRTTIALMALSSSGITRPSDLVNKQLGVATGAVPETLFPAYAQLAGISDPASVHWTPTTPQGLPALLVSKRVAAIGQFVVGAPAIQAAAKKAGLTDTIVTLPYSDYVSDLYGNVTVAPTKLINSNPDLVRRFNRAYIKSLGAALADPTGVGTILHKHVATQLPAPATAEVKLLVPYCGTGQQIGTMDEAKVARGIAILQGVGMIPASFDPKKMVDFDIVADLNKAS